MKELWQNERSKAGITLGLWMVFILFIFALISCSNTKDVPADKKEEITIKEKIDTFLKNDLSYKITVEENDSRKIFNVSYKNNEYEGYLQDNIGITKFNCKENKCYTVYLDHQDEIEEYYFKDDLDIFSIRNISDKLSLEKSLSNDTNYVYTYNEESKAYQINLNEDRIEKIIIKADPYQVIYDINYNN